MHYIVIREQAILTELYSFNGIGKKKRFDSFNV